MTDDELIITNEEDLDITTETPSEPQSDSNGTSTGATDEPTFRQALEEQIHEEDSPITTRVSLTKILGGDFFTAQILRRNIWLILLIVGIIILYVSNRYSVQKSMIEIDNLKNELQNAKYKSLSVSSQLTEQSRQSNVLDMLKSCQDSALRIADKAPYIIEAPE